MSDWSDSTVKIVKASLLTVMVIAVLIMAIVALWPH